jgi:hypothetical protein
MRTALQLFGKGSVRYLVLEEGVREALLKGVPALAGQVDVFEHPLPPNEGEATTVCLSLPIRFGFVGLANRYRGFPIFLRLASQMTESCREQVEFHAIGTLRDERLRIKGLEALATQPAARRLDRESFVQKLKQLHYVIFPFQREYYESVASGSLLDAIAFEKPIIASDIPIFGDLFKKFGEMGYLCSSEADFRSTLENIVTQPDPQKYAEHVRNMRGLKASRTPRALAAKFSALAQCNSFDS